MYRVFLRSTVSNHGPPAVSAASGHSQIVKEPGPLGARKRAAMVLAAFLPACRGATRRNLAPEGLHHPAPGTEGWERGSSRHISAKQSSTSAASSD